MCTTTVRKINKFSFENIAVSSKYYMKLSLCMCITLINIEIELQHTRTIWYNINLLFKCCHVPITLTISLFAFEIMMLLCSAAACGLKREYCYWTLALPSAFNHTLLSSSSYLQFIKISREDFHTGASLAFWIVIM